jgi:capsular exopolysaccharide synthesis family protein
MRAKFEYKASQQNSNVLLVTSVLENEGKSTIAVNLALALMQKSKNVLLIDADFAKPSIHKILQKDVRENQEIGEFIIKKSDMKDALTFDENSGLYLLIGSRLYKNSTELIAREDFRKLISITKKKMDYIIIDAPPITASADAEILADIADVSLLVVKQSTAKAKDINDAIDILSKSNSKLLGCVFNNVRNAVFSHQLGYGHKYSYKNYYGYYGAKAAH